MHLYLKEKVEVLHTAVLMTQEILRIPIGTHHAYSILPLLVRLIFAEHILACVSGDVEMRYESRNEL